MATPRGCERLSRQQGSVASFSRAPSEVLSARPSDDDFHAMLDGAAQSIYEASPT